MHAVLPAGYEHQPQNKAPDYFNHAEDYHQSESHPNLLINPKTNRVVDSQSGEDVTDQLLTDPNLKGLASQLGQEIKEHKESIAKSVFDPHIAKRKADIARLKAEMSELEMHKVNSGLIGSYAEQGAPESYYKNPVFGIPIAAGQADAYMRANTPAQHKGNLYNDLKGMGEQAYQYLFGE